MIDATVYDLAKRVIALYRSSSLTLTTIESCTGGLLAAALTSVEGASDVFERGFVTYSNRAKHELVGVSLDTITTYGAVSESVAQAMASGGLARSTASVALAITGVAGPGGGTDVKPVGLVHFALAGCEGTQHHERIVFTETSRQNIQRAAVLKALSLLERFVLEVKAEAPFSQDHGALAGSGDV